MVRFRQAARSISVRILNRGGDIQDWAPSSQKARQKRSKETVFEIFVLDSTAINGKHRVAISLVGQGDQGIYIESLTIHRPGEDNKEFSIFKGGGLDGVFKPINGPGIETPSRPTFDTDAPLSGTQGRSFFPDKA